MTIKMICVHCSATTPDMDIGAAEIDEWHKARGFDRIGYNYVIRRDGTAERGRHEGETLAHAKGYNQDAIAVCLIGGVTAEGDPAANFTDAQFETLDHFIGWMRARYPQASVLGHRDLPGVAKDCPCFNVQQWIKTGLIAEPRKTE